jgi:tetratricopeptide (TPR) repeat protein
VTFSEEVAQDLQKSINHEVGEIAHSMAEGAHVPQEILESIDLQAHKIEHELSQCMLLAKTRIKDGFKACVEAVKELARDDSTINLEELKDNVDTAFSRFESVAIAKDMCIKVMEGTSWKTLLGLNDTSTQLLYRGAKKLFDQGLYPESEAAFYFLTTIDYGQYVFWLGLGHAAFHLNNLNQAINAYEMASTCQPGSVWPHIYMANCFEALLDYEESLHSLREAETELLNDPAHDHGLMVDLKERIANAKSRS